MSSNKIILNINDDINISIDKALWYALQTSLNTDNNDDVISFKDEIKVHIRNTENDTIIYDIF